MENNSSLPPKILSKSPWSNARDPIWPATSLAIHRNIHSYCFPKKLSEVEAGQILEMIIGAAKKVLDAPFIIKGETLSPQDKELLFEHFLLQESFENFGSKNGFLLEEKSNLLALINIEDHLTLQILEPSTPVQEIWKRLSSIDQAISKHLHFAFSPRFGYLTSELTSCGTGLVAVAFLHVPALLHSGAFQEWLEKIPQDIKVRGLGQNGEYLADLLLIENKFKLGIWEGTILNTIEKTAQTLVEEEKRIRLQLNTQSCDFLKDKIGRALGLLKHSYSLQIQEALAALSLVHLGKELGWIEGNPETSFHSLFFDCGRGHLQTKCPSGQKDIPQLRSKFLQDKFQSYHFKNL